jgi:uncharacterized protein YbcI
MPDELPRLDDAEGLARAGREAGAEVDEGQGHVRAAVANALVGMKARFYGRGPEKAKAYIVDDYLFCAMEGGLTRNEEVLVADGKEDLVRRYRLEFEASMAATVMGAVADLVGRPVLTYHSQIVFDPVRTFEIFVLGEGEG